MNDDQKKKGSCSLHDRGQPKQGRTNRVERMKKLSHVALLSDLNEQWPSLKFLGFGCYYAWIWLCYDSGVLVLNSQETGAADSIFVMYLLSTAALTFMLITLAFIANRVERIFDNQLIILGMGLFASVSTGLVAMTATTEDGYFIFIVSSAATGIGTAFVALRLGIIYGAVPARQATMYILASFVFACMLYFVGIGLPESAGLVFASALPFFAALCTVVDLPNKSVTTQNAVSDHARSPTRLSRSFFMRFAAAIFVFAVIVGITRGYAALSESIVALSSKGIVVVSSVGAIAAILFIAVGLTTKRFNISKIYYPAIILAAVGMLIMPIISLVSASPESVTFEQGIIGIAYALFILVIWCLCAHLSYSTSISPIMVFGWGRGSSAGGTTIGWLLGSVLIQETENNVSLLLAISIIMAFLLVVIVTLVLSNKTIQEVFEQKGADSDSKTVTPGDMFPKQLVDNQGFVDGKKDDKQPVSWISCCKEIANEANLSPREREVMLLLARGRTIDYIHDKLGISMNTAKSHVRNVYTKLGIHTRQELLDVVEQRHKRNRTN